jgi:SOS-response transcriptional repressor LexA
MGRRKLLSTREVFQAIKDALKKRDMPPTIEELRVALKVGSTRTILRYLRSLEEDGLIERWPGARGMRVKHWGKNHGKRRK